MRLEQRTKQKYFGWGETARQRRRRTTFVVLAGLVGLLGSTSARAVTLNVVEGQLLGASGVDVGGALFDVEFVDGTCIELFNGCDSSADFLFGTFDDASEASQALLDQVFLDGDLGLFDNIPFLTRGCEDFGKFSSCAATTPYGFQATNGITVRFARNEGVNQLNGGDGVGSLDGITTDQFSGGVGLVYAVWSPVPEPGSIMLLGTGLLAMGITARRTG